MSITVIENFLPNPEEYRTAALTLDFRTFDFGHVKFHGIAPIPIESVIPEAISNKFDALKPHLTFFRKSPRGQVEPHFIHTDVDMGQWSAILYLNPEPHGGDGTDFWIHKATMAIQSGIAHQRSVEGNVPDKWILREHVQAKFNRLLLFPSSYFHSRAIPQNYGEGDGARLTQVTFGAGDLESAIRGRAA